MATIVIAVPEIIAVPLAPDPAWWRLIQRIWERGDAVAPLPHAAPSLHLQRLLAAVQPTRIATDTFGAEVRHPGRPCAEGDALIMVTSGTSGRPKAVVHTRDGMMASANITAEALDSGPSSHWLACLPVAHIGGFSVLTRALFSGAKVTIAPGAQAADIDTAAQRGATHVSLVPAQLAAVDTRRWQRILLGGSRPSADRPSNCVATYGMTETGGGIVYDGLALPGVELAIGARPDTPQSEGTIWLRSPTMFRAYRTADGEGPATNPQGWFSTGDIGAIDEGGVLRVIGRSDDVIISGGHKVWPDPVERILERIEGVRGVAVIGVPHHRWGEVVTAVIEFDPRLGAPPTLEVLRAAVAEALPRYCEPRALRVVDNLPRVGVAGSGLAKISRAATRTLLLGQNKIEPR